ncbi:ATP-binding cassette domain-containing protein, partial [Bacteroides acidifaciens]|uniref:ATP-binding cassette domain-containing protein n=1 Tax=Bacteroides acidifaciens TaxID=85831 RepID=UPI00259B5802
MLKIDHLTFFYPHRTKPVIDDFSMELPAGGVYGLLGRNGAGKSTLLYLIAGLLTPKSGNVAFAGTDTRLRRPKTLADIFIVPEEFNLPSMSLD